MTEVYETGDALRQYLDFHYRGGESGYLPHHPLPDGVLDYPRRCAEVVRDFTGESRNAVLDVGCAVGGSTFHLSTHFDQVVGVDFSRAFIEAAETLRRNQRMEVGGQVYTPPSGARPERIRFVRGDACALPEDLGRFDAVLMANLLCRLPDPAACLRGVRSLLRAGGVLVITSPCSWDAAYTPLEKQLVPTLESLHRHLDPWCENLEEADMPFVLRVHERRAEFTVALRTVWRVRDGSPVGTTAL